MLLKQEKGSFKNAQEIIFVFWEIKPQKKSFLEILDKKRMLFRPQKGSFQKLQPMEIFQSG